MFNAKMPDNWAIGSYLRGMSTRTKSLWISLVLSGPSGPVMKRAEVPDGDSSIRATTKVRVPLIVSPKPTTPHKVRYLGFHVHRS